MERYVIYIGENIQAIKSDLSEAQEVYNLLPSGEGKRPSLRRSLVKETIICEDNR